MDEPEGQQGGNAPTSREDIRSGAWSSEFYMYSFKVVPCSATYAHNWSLCPFVHPNEKARRRDPRVHSYEPLPCPFDKKGANCPHGDACNYTHNVYEYWLHPKRFRTQMCQQGAGCKRPLCFFAHNLQELRFAEGQLQRGGAPAAQDPSAGLAAAAAAGAQASLLPGLADARQQQAAAAAAAAAAALGAGPYMPALVPYALMSPIAATANLPPLQGGGGLMPAALAGGAGMQQGRPMGAGQALQQQQAWLPGFITPQGYVVLGNAQGQLLPGGPMVGGDVDPAFQQQQQQYLPTMGQWHHGGAAGAPAASSAGAAAAVAACMPMAGSTSGYNALHLDPALDPALMSSQFSVVPDEHVLLSQTGGVRGDSSSSSFAVLQQQQQQHQQQRQQQDAAAAAAAAAAVSGYSWINPVAPSTTSASVSMSVLSVPTVGLSSSASVPGSSNNSLSHIKPGQSGAPVSLDVLQATMQQMSMRDCHVRDL